MDYKKYITVKATPDEVYNALTNKLSLKLMTGAEAVYEKLPGEDFSLYDGDICGKNISYKEGKEIVQQWYFGDLQPSEVVIRVHNKDGATSLEWRQTNIPDNDYEEFTMGLENILFPAITDFFD